MPHGFLSCVPIMSISLNAQNSGLPDVRPDVKLPSETVGWKAIAGALKALLIYDFVDVRCARPRRISWVSSPIRRRTTEAHTKRKLTGAGSLHLVQGHTLDSFV